MLLLSFGQLLANFWKVDCNLSVSFGDLAKCYFWAFGYFCLTFGKLVATFKILPKSYRNSESNFPKVAKDFQFYFQILTKSGQKSIKVFQMLPKSSKSFPKVVQSLKVRFQRLPKVTPNIKLPTSLARAEAGRLGRTEWHGGAPALANWNLKFERGKIKQKLPQMWGR